MNTTVQLSLIAPEPDTFLRLVEESFDYFERLLSRFRPDSELSRLNAYPSTEFQASPDFFSAVEAALWASQQTAGLYDPTILDYLEEAGYDRTFSAVPNPRPLFKDCQGGSYAGQMAKTIAHPPEQVDDYRRFSLDLFTQQIGRPAGLRLDLGGMGKGWTVDRVADLLCEQGYFLLNAGGDLYAYGMPHGKQGWVVNLAHPLHPDSNYASLLVDHHAVATSTIARRRWMKNGVTQHHLIDPRTGRPAQTDVISVSVVAGRVFTAEVYAKTALILGTEAGLAFLESLPEVEGVVFSQPQEIHLTSGASRYLTQIDPSSFEETSIDGYQKEYAK